MGSRTPARGETAPSFELPDIHGRPVHLESLRGRPVLLVFLPFAFSPVCTSEVRDLHALQPQLARAGAQALVISCDPVPALRAWAEAEGIDFPLLSDFWPHGAAALEYGVLNTDSGYARRGSFLLDARGRLTWSVLQESGRARSPEWYAQALARCEVP